MKALIIAGGKGTRSKSDTPKILQKVNGESVLETLLSHLTTLHNLIPIEIAFLLGHKANEVLEVVKTLRKNYPIIGKAQCFVEENPLGPGGAISQFRENLSQEFLILMGDLFVDFNFYDFINFSRARNANFSSVVHPNTHSFDSDVAYLSSIDNRIEEFDLKNSRTGTPQSVLAFAGIHYLHISSPESLLESKEPIGLIEYLLEYNGLHFKNKFGYVTCEFVKDMGTPSRIQEIQNSLRVGAIERRSKKKAKAAIFLDRDSTLISNGGPPGSLSIGTALSIRKTNEFGIPVIVVSNQPNVAKGFVTIYDVDVLHREIDIQLERRKAFIDAWYWCPHYPIGGFEGEVRAWKLECQCRKPKFGLIEFAAHDHGLDLNKSYFVGDSLSDKVAAELINVSFLHTTEFLKCQIEDRHNCFPSTSEAIDYAVEGIVK
jgi:histidinol-phosphate phosphatase family protein